MAVRLEYDTVQELLNEIELDPVVAAAAAVPLVVISEAEYNCLQKRPLVVPQEERAPWVDDEAVLAGAKKGNVLLSWGMDNDRAGKFIYFVCTSEEKRRKFTADLREVAAHNAAEWVIHYERKRQDQRPTDQMDLSDVCQEMAVLGWGFYEKTFVDGRVSRAWIKDGKPAMVAPDEVWRNNDKREKWFRASLMQARTHAENDAREATP